jgi:hypothetical protein
MSDGCDVRKNKECTTTGTHNNHPILAEPAEAEIIFTTTNRI